MKSDIVEESNKNELLVSIVINNCNYDAFLRRAIDSALEQKYSNVEVIIVDDGSTDLSRFIIDKYGKSVIPVYKKNGGQASAFNAGIASCRGEIICFLDSDDYFAPHKVGRIVELLELFPIAGWVFHEVQYVDKNGIIFINRGSLLVSKTQLLDVRADIKKGRKIDEPRSPTSGLCFHRDLLNQILPIPEQLIITADQFVLLAALYLTPGIKTNERLAFQRIHGKNLWTFRKGNDQLKAEIRLLTAYYLRLKFPDTSRFANKFFCFVLGELLSIYGLSGVRNSNAYRDYVKRYFSIKAWIRYIPRIIYHFVRSKWKKLKRRNF